MNSIIKVCSVYGTVFARLAIGAAFLSSCADRLGLWGGVGANGVAWGDFNSFLEYFAQLNPYLPPDMVPAMGWFDTIAESVLGIMLIIGLKTRLSAFLSGTLLLGFALAMTLVSGIKSPFDYSVFSAAAGCFLLSAQASYLWSIDSWRRNTEDPNTAAQKRI